jgi:exodeoxyribonuclease-3
MEQRMTRLASWNVNGIRAASTKGFFQWMADESADIVCLQETKADPSQLTKEFFEADDAEGKRFTPFWSSAKRRGYSGVAIYTRLTPRSVRLLGVEEFDDEGRYLEADFGEFVVASAYFPNSQDAGARIDYKLRFCEAVLARCDTVVAEGRHIVVAGDFNVAHEPIDLARPKDNEGNPGYLPQERAWMAKYLSSGYSDTFRSLHPGEPGHYSWWSYRMKAREKDIGWRIDYHCVDEGFVPAVKSAAIRNAVLGSDHCPVTLELEF